MGQRNAAATHGAMYVWFYAAGLNLTAALALQSGYLTAIKTAPGVGLLLSCPGLYTPAASWLGNTYLLPAFSTGLCCSIWHESDTMLPR